jgi:hypothetical protein
MGEPTSKSSAYIRFRISDDKLRKEQSSRRATTAVVRGMGMGWQEIMARLSRRMYFAVYLRYQVEACGRFRKLRGRRENGRGEVRATKVRQVNGTITAD